MCPFCRHVGSAFAPGSDCAWRACQERPRAGRVRQVCAGKDPLTVREIRSKSRKTEGEAQIELGRMLVLAGQDCSLTPITPCPHAWPLLLIAVFFTLSLQRYQRLSR
jgi:hypothetical protein